MSFVYLAAPYTHPNAAVRELRYQMINAFAARLMEHGFAVFSPISQSHEASRFLPAELDDDHEFWMQVDLPILERASGLIVLALGGWEKSRGVQREIQHAHAHGIPDVGVRNFDPMDDFAATAAWIRAAFLKKRTA